MMWQKRMVTQHVSALRLGTRTVTPVHSYHDANMTRHLLDPDVEDEEWLEDVHAAMPLPESDDEWRPPWDTVLTTPPPYCQPLIETRSTMLPRTYVPWDDMSHSAILLPDPEEDWHTPRNATRKKPSHNKSHGLCGDDDWYDDFIPEGNSLKPVCQSLSLPCLWLPILSHTYLTTSIKDTHLEILPRHQVDLLFPVPEYSINFSPAE